MKTAENETAENETAQLKTERGKSGSILHLLRNL